MPHIRCADWIIFYLFFFFFFFVSEIPTTKKCKKYFFLKKKKRKISDHKLTQLGFTENFSLNIKTQKRSKLGKKARTNW